MKIVYKFIEKQYLNSVDGFIFNSQTTKATVQKFVPSLPGNVIAHPGGDGLKGEITEKGVRQRASEQRPLRVLFLGSITRRKGLHTLLDACDQLERGLVELTLIGSKSAEPGYARQIQARIFQLKNKISIKILDAQSAESLPKEIIQHDVLVVPSSYEGFGIVYLEGMAFGLPAIATTSGAAHETIHHDHNGYLIKPADSQTLAKHLITLTENRTELLRLSLNALITHKQGPTWEAMAKKIHRYLMGNAGKNE